MDWAICINPILEEDRVEDYFCDLIESLFLKSDSKFLGMYIEEMSKGERILEEEVVRDKVRLYDTVRLVADGKYYFSLNILYIMRSNIHINIKIFLYGKGYFHEYDLYGPILVEMQFKNISKDKSGIHKYRRDIIKYTDRTYGVINVIEKLSLDMIYFLGYFSNVRGVWSGLSDSLLSPDLGIMMYHHDFMSFVKDIYIIYGWYIYGLPVYSMHKVELRNGGFDRFLEGEHHITYIPTRHENWIYKSKTLKEFCESLNKDNIEAIMNIDEDIVVGVIQRSQEALPRIRHRVIGDRGLMLSVDTHHDKASLLPFYRYLYDELSAAL